jgi:ABC-type cobalamin/Fe3+-siderophores transport system ATPase subunit
MSELLLEARHLTKRYATQAVVDHLSLQIARGECLGIIGPNGAGKTTNIRMCLGLTVPDAGEIHALGLSMAQGLTLSSGFYWDQTDASRAFAKRFFAERKAMPTRNQASIYLATLHFLKAMAQAGTRDPMAVGRAMRALPVDYFGRSASVRADGRVLYDVTLYRVKAPAESKAPWDYYAPIATLPAAEAFLPMNPACA